MTQPILNSGNPIYDDLAQPYLSDSLNDKSDLGSALISIHNYIYANDGLSPQEAFGEIVKLLFMKVQDEKRSEQEQASFHVSTAEIADLQTDRIRDSDFLTRIHSLFNDSKTHWPLAFRPDEILHLRPLTLGYAVRELQPILLSGHADDVKGAAFQKMVTAASRGDRGQFFTPGPVVRLMVDLVRPGAHELILDPACGTGGFLIETVRRLRAVMPDRRIGNVHGVEINPAVARIAMIQVLLEGGQPENVRRADALSDDVLSNGLNAGVDVILTNPPFGSQGRITDRRLLGKFQLARRWRLVGGVPVISTDLQTGQVPDILFIERCLQLLRDGGRLAIVLPNGDLENSSLGYVRAFIKDQAEVQGVVALPPETFVPFGTGVKASVLLLRKSDASERRSSVFFGVVRKIGYGGGKHSAPIYKRTQNGNVELSNAGLPVLDEDVSQVAMGYLEYLQDRLTSSDTRFTVPVVELTDRLDAAFYSPQHKTLAARLERGSAVPLAQIATIVGRKSKALRVPNGVIDYVELSDVDTATATIRTSRQMRVFECPSRATYEIRTGDVLTAVSGNAVGTHAHPTALVTEQHDGKVCSNGFRILNATGVHPLYLLSVLRRPEVLAQVQRFRTGAAIPSISDADLMAVLIPLPPHDIQERVVTKIQEALELRGRAQAIFDSAFDALDP